MMYKAVELLESYKLFCEKMQKYLIFSFATLILSVFIFLFFPIISYVLILISITVFSYVVLKQNKLKKEISKNIPSLVLAWENGYRILTDIAVLEDDYFDVVVGPYQLKIYPSSEEAGKIIEFHYSGFPCTIFIKYSNNYNLFHLMLGLPKGNFYLLSITKNGIKEEGNKEILTEELKSKISELLESFKNESLTVEKLITISKEIVNISKKLKIPESSSRKEMVEKHEEK